jgi:hypothetical protein
VNRALMAQRPLAVLLILTRRRPGGIPAGFRLVSAVRSSREAWAPLPAPPGPGSASPLP